MALERKDAEATALTVLIVLAFLATHQGWGVPLIGSSHRWAAGAITLLGILTCGLGSPARGFTTWICAGLGTLALVLAGLSIATGSLTSLSLLVVVDVVLWAISTRGHVRHAPTRSIPA